MANKASSRSRRYRDLARAFLPPKGEAARELAPAYARLFLVPGPRVVHPYESAYLEGRLMGEAAVQVAKCYAEAGLQVSDAAGDLPDHVSLELSFMSFLAAQEALDPNHAGLWLGQQHRFLRGHLARWVPGFCEQLLASEAHRFYRQAALSTLRLLQEEMAGLSTGARPPGGRAGSRALGAQPSKPQRPERPGRYPNIRLILDPSLCTLCTLCTDNCRPEALAVDCSPASLRLVLDPARCNGCRACMRMCPERAIRIEHGPPRHTPSRSSRRVLAAAPRVLCPGCHRPHIAAPWLERLAHRLGGGEATRLSLALCPACKTTRDVGPAVLAGLPQEPARSA